jgi:3-phenylpropionate/trans-cinnamate dioxygenase ferredoxin reductase subunit
VKRVAIVGASLAGWHAAKALRREGFDGILTLIGAEPHRPYDRPPLSKEYLAGSADEEKLSLAGALDDDLDVTWRLGQPATGLDLAGRAVHLADGTNEAFDGLVIATGGMPRMVAEPSSGMAGVHVLRTLDEARALRAELDAVPGRVVVVGAGFIGAEVAATCRGRGLPVTILEALPVPLARALGPEIGAACADVQRDHDVDLRLGAGVDRLEGGARVERVVLSDGSVIDADVVVVGVGVRPATEWLEGSGLTLDDGIVCDATCLAAPGVVAAGDVARWPNAAFGGEVMRVEHWDNAIEMGGYAARRLLGGDAWPAGEPFAPIPWFWSDDEVVVIDGSVAERRFAAAYGRAGRLVAVFGMNRPRQVMQFRSLIGQEGSWDEVLRSRSG